MDVVTGSTTQLTVASAYASHSVAGGTVSTAGSWRTPNGYSIYSRNAAANNVRMVEFDGTDLLLGTNPHASGIRAYSASGIYVHQNSATAYAYL